jgi:putative ABC transport system permease protein
MTPHTNLFKQVRGLLPYALGNMWRARWPSLTIIACVLLVIVILNAFLSMARGFSATARSAGSESIAIVLGRGSESEANSQVTPEQIACWPMRPASQASRPRS